MRINSDESIKAVEKVLHQYGSWSAMLEAATYEDGVYKVPSKSEVTETHAEPPATATN